MKNNKAVIVDVDGTLCDVRPVRHHVMQKPKNFAAFHAGAADCPPHPEAVEWALAHADAGYKVVIVTARRYEWERQTTDWVRTHLPCDFLGPFMRGDNDYRPDVEVKRDIYNKLVNDHGLELVEAIDDNPAICDLWESLGLKVKRMPGWNSFYPETHPYNDGTFPIGGMSTVEEVRARAMSIGGQPVRVTNVELGAFDETAPSKGLMQVDGTAFYDRSLYEGQLPTPEEP